MKVESLELDDNNIEFKNAVELVKYTDKMFYLTGKAGTGKTTFLKYIKKTTTKNTIIVAPTGVAALNARGVTIHSFFQIPFGPFVPNDTRLRNSGDDTNKETIYTTFGYKKGKLKIIKNLELLIIDEISMVRADTLDVIDKILKAHRREPNKPFGGVQVLLIGDTFQLAPIANDEQWDILSDFYDTPFFFDSNVIKNTNLTYLELKKIYRQTDKQFIDLLNKVRESKLTNADFNKLNSRYDPYFSSEEESYITLATHNYQVNNINESKLDELDNAEFEYEAGVDGDFSEKIMPTDEILSLKEGAQIMFIKNDPEEGKRFYNGKLGKIYKLEDDKITVSFDNGNTVAVKPVVWENIKYKLNKKTNKVEEEILGTFTQYPLRLAWAITVHKSQGLTFEKVIADLDQAFATGQSYVALSRCTSFDGLVLKSKLHTKAIKTDSSVLKFAKTETATEIIIKDINVGKYIIKQQVKNDTKTAESLMIRKISDLEFEIDPKSKTKVLIYDKDKNKTLGWVTSNQDNQQAELIEQFNSVYDIHFKILSVSNGSKIEEIIIKSVTSIDNKVNELLYKAEDNYEKGEKDDAWESIKTAIILDANIVKNSKIFNDITLESSIDKVSIQNEEKNNDIKKESRIIMKVKIIDVEVVRGSVLKSNWRSSMYKIYTDQSDGFYIDAVNDGTDWRKYKGKLITNIYTTESSGYTWLQSNETPEVLEAPLQIEDNQAKSATGEYCEELIKISNLIDANYLMLSTYLNNGADSAIIDSVAKMQRDVIIEKIKNLCE